MYAHRLQQSLETTRVPYEMAGLANEHENQTQLTTHHLGLSLVPCLGRPGPGVGSVRRPGSGD